MSLTAAAIVISSLMQAEQQKKAAAANRKAMVEAQPTPPPVSLGGVNPQLGGNLGMALTSQTQPSSIPPSFAQQGSNLPVGAAMALASNAPGASLSALDQPPIDVRESLGEVTPGGDFQLQDVAAAQEGAVEQGAILAGGESSEIEAAIGDIDGGGGIEGQAATGDISSGDIMIALASIYSTISRPQPRKPQPRFPGGTTGIGKPPTPGPLGAMLAPGQINLAPQTPASFGQFLGR